MVGATSWQPPTGGLRPRWRLSYGSLEGNGATNIVGIIADANLGYRLITSGGEAIAFETTQGN
jgi:hypothetical protein